MTPNVLVCEIRKDGNKYLSREQDKLDKSKFYAYTMFTDNSELIIIPKIEYTQGQVTGIDAIGLYVNKEFKLSLCSNIYDVFEKSREKKFWTIDSRLTQKDLAQQINIFNFKGIEEKQNFPSDKRIDIFDNMHAFLYFTAIQCDSDMIAFLKEEKYKHYENNPDIFKQKIE